MSFLDVIRDRLWSHLHDEIAISEAPEGRIECSTMFFYDDGDAVVVWAESDEDGQIAVADYNEAWMRLAGSGHESEAEHASALCLRYGLTFSDGSVIGRGAPDEAGDIILRVAEASARLAATAAETSKSDDAGGKKGATAAFRRLVADTFRGRHLDVSTNLPVVGVSGKKHRIPIFLPNTELLIAPIPARSAGSQLSSVFMSFADVGSVNGYRALAILDDRGGIPEEETVSLLSQVGSTALWSQRDEWIPAVVADELGPGG